MIDLTVRLLRWNARVNGMQSIFSFWAVCSAVCRSICWARWRPAWTIETGQPRLSKKNGTLPLIFRKNQSRNNINDEVWETVKRVGPFYWQKKLVFGKTYEKIGVAGSHFSTHDHSISLFVVVVLERIYRWNRWTTSRPGYREHLPDTERNDKDASKPIARRFYLPNHSK